MINAGQYKGQAIKGSVQLGETERGTLQIAIDMELFNDKEESVGQMTTFLYFSDAAAVYSYERLRALGWEGEGADDIDKLDGIFETKVPVRVTAPESYTASGGETKMGTSKLEILTGEGRVTLTNTVDSGTFKARLRALSGSGGGSGSSAGASPGSKEGPEPPF